MKKIIYTILTLFLYSKIQGQEELIPTSKFTEVGYVYDHVAYDILHEFENVYDLDIKFYKNDFHYILHERIDSIRYPVELPLKESKFSLGFKDVCFKKYFSIDDITNKNVKSINFTDCEFQDEISIHNNQIRFFNFNTSIYMYDNVYISSNTAKTTSLNFKEVEFTGSLVLRNINRISMDIIFMDSTHSRIIFVDSINNASFSKCKFPIMVDFSDTYLSGYFKFNSGTLPDTFNFTNANFSNLKNDIDLTFLELKDSKKRWNLVNPNNKHLCTIKLDGADASKFRLRYENFQLLFNPDATFETKSYIYEELLNRSKKEGMSNSYKKLMIEYKQLQYNNFMNFVQKHWWNYGFDKQLIFRNTLIILLFLTMINWMVFEYLLSEVYPINNFTERFNIISQHYPNNQLYVLPLAFFYTCVIFFGFKLDLASIKLKNYWAVLYIFFVYSIGLFCVAYMASVILKLDSFL